MSDELVGQRLGSFTIKSLLGQGGMARVYRAHQHSLDREVALKVIRRIPGDAHDVVARFQREKQVMQKLEHGNILPIYDYASNADYLWIAMRLVEGGTLDQLKMPPERLGSVIRQLASALDFAHSLGVIHRDIKPCNVLVDKGEHLYLMDFGVAKMLEQEGLTAPGTTVGTPEYMSPEQLQGKELDGRSDQYALAVMAYELATGQLPFRGQLLEVMTQHIKTPPVPPHKLNPRLPEAASEAILRALAKSPADRFESTVAFAQALEAGLSGTGTSIPTVAAVPPGKSRALPMVAAGAGLALLLAAAWAMRPGPSYRPGKLAYEARAAGGDVQVRAADGTISKVSQGQNPHFGPGGELWVVRNGQLVHLDAAGKAVGSPLAGVSDASVAPGGSSLVLVKNGLWHQPLRDGKPDGKPEELVEKGKDPSFSPDGSEVAYAAEGHIWSVNLKSKRRSSLSSPGPGENDSQPAWSPDGKQVAYQRKLAKGSQLRITQATGEARDQVVKVPADCGWPEEPSWSPNSLLVFCSEKGIYAVAPDGSHLQRLVQAPAGVRLASPEWAE